MWRLYSTAHDLVPIFKTSTIQDVITRTRKLFRLDYCFGTSHQYNIAVTVIAEDQQSGFATYACKKTYKQGKCDVFSPYYDISGGAVNVVQMELDGPQDYGPVLVLVRGDGRYGQVNNFTIAASAPY